MAAQDHGTQQTHVPTQDEQREDQPIDHAKQQDGDAAKAEVLDNFEIQRRRFFGK